MHRLFIELSFTEGSLWLLATHSIFLQCILLFQGAKGERGDRGLDGLPGVNGRDASSSQMSSKTNAVPMPGPPGPPGQYCCGSIWRCDVYDPSTNPFRTRWQRRIKGRKGYFELLCHHNHRMNVYVSHLVYNNCPETYLFLMVNRPVMTEISM